MARGPAAVVALDAIPASARRMIIDTNRPRPATEGLAEAKAGAPKPNTKRVPRAKQAAYLWGV